MTPEQERYLCILAELQEPLGEDDEEELCGELDVLWYAMTPGQVGEIRARAARMEVER